MKPSAIAIFPFKEDYENGCLKRAHTVNDMLLSAIRAWLVTPKGSRLGNMVGCFLPDILFDLISYDDLSGLASRLKQDAQEQFPDVNFISVTMELDRSNDIVDLIVKLTISTSVTDIKQLEVILPTGTKNK